MSDLDETRVTLHRSREGSHEVTVNRVVGTTECAKLAAVAPESQKIGEFIEWLGEQGMVICAMNRKSELWWPTGEPINSLLADYFEIDLDKVEEERRALLDALQESHR